MELYVVRSTGGLADTVIDSSSENIKARATGFVFNDADVGGLCYGIDSAFTLWRKPSQWESVIVNAMEQDFSCRHHKRYQSLS